MRKRGIKRKDNGCCPAHDKFPNESYNTRPSQKAKRKTDKLANRRAREWDKVDIRAELNNVGYE